MSFTTQVQVRKAFKNCHRHLDFNKVTDHSGTGLMYKTDTRVTFVNYVDDLCRAGRITPELAAVVTLG